MVNARDVGPVLVGRHRFGVCVAAPRRHCDVAMLDERCGEREKIIPRFVMLRGGTVGREIGPPWIGAPTVAVLHPFRPA